MTDTNITSTEPEQNGELEELLEHWKNLARMYGSHQTDTFNARCETYATCVEELEEALDDV